MRCRRPSRSAGRISHFLTSSKRHSAKYFFIELAKHDDRTAESIALAVLLVPNVVNAEGPNGPGEISNSQAAGHVRANASFDGGAGGLVGANVGATINQSFSTGSVKGGTAGGFVGFSANSDGAAVITESYSTGAVDGVSGDGVGGFIGYGGGASACYWDITTSGISGGDTSGITGLTSKQLRSGLPAGFDPAVWAEKRKINNGFPYLIADPPLK